MVVKITKQSICNLTKTYSLIINRLYDIYPVELKPLKYSFDFSVSKYEQIIEDGNTPLYKLQNGLLQGLCEIPLILKNLLMKKEFEVALATYNEEISNNETKEIVENFFYKNFLRIIKKNRIRNEEDFWIAQLMLDLSSKNSNFLNKSDIQKLIYLIDDFSSKL